MNGWSIKEEIEICHKRADHEDNLNLSRTTMLITLNSFFAVAVSITTVRIVLIVYSSVVLLIDLAWTSWAPNVRKFIKLLRENHGSERPDQKKWSDSVGESEKTLPWVKDPLTRMC